MSPYKVVTFKERRDRLRLMRSARVGPRNYAEIMAHFGHASAALEGIPEMARNGGARSIKLCSEAQAHAELEQLDAIGASFVTYGEPGYPPALMPVQGGPPGLAVLGDPELLARDLVAIVGARNASGGGRRLALEMAGELGQYGYVVVSGMARGIDRAAHLGALEHATVAVMAGGVDHIYPNENKDIYARIRDTGAIVSEMAPGTQATARHFPRRNRIISGLSLGTVIVEAATRSGSLITARAAGEQGRIVMGVPGSPGDMRTAGPNRLIREGATLVRHAADVIDAIQPLTGRAVEVDEVPEAPAVKPLLPGDREMDQARDLVAECLSPSAITVDEILRECQLSQAIVQTVLLEFELAGRIERQPGGKVATV